MTDTAALTRMLETTREAWRDMETNALEIAVQAARIALAERPRPSQVTQGQAAEMLGISRWTVAKMVESGQLRLNGCGRIPIGQIDKLLAPSA
ncbi:hypothetical protein R77569_04352 [Ralstonia mannitolilytica]|uniref:Helix-turn-helix domain-containing protein n=1 Tax=Ralstonia mannitolilytica TaxID=105219 RepID=A0ABM9L0M9_9RALS|nr:DNA-binding protein [Ralstonia mannitolilytica]CAJ0893897.1 hypothetical protein R77569_04352 [Ralstonia mannitolilytica]